MSLPFTHKKATCVVGSARSNGSTAQLIAAMIEGMQQATRRISLCGVDTPDDLIAHHPNALQQMRMLGENILSL